MSTVKNHSIIDDLAISEALYGLIRRVEETYNAVSGTLNIWASRIEERRQLAQMNDRLLNDIGLSRADVATEINKHFWQK